MKKLLLTVLIIVLAACPVNGQESEESGEEQISAEMPSVEQMGEFAQRLDEEESEGLARPIQILMMVTLLSILPGILLMGTAFTRIVIVLAFVSRALSTRQIPPSPVVIGLAMFLSIFVMSPTLGEMNREALQPYMEGDIVAQDALEKGVMPLRGFMMENTGRRELSLFISMSSMESRPEDESELPTMVLIPAFVTSELKKAFELGFILYLPFLVLDMVVASVLLSMGMMMLPPVIVSAPLKILLFVLVDGWVLIARSLVTSFGGG